MQSEQTDFDMIASRGDWVLSRASSEFGNAVNPSYFLLLLRDEEPTPTEVLTFQRMAEIKNLITGTRIQFETQPSPGFILRTTQNWGFESPELAQRSLEKLLWEIERDLRR